MNKICFLNALLLILGGCGGRWVVSPSGGRAFRLTDGQENCIVLQVKSMRRRGSVIGCVDTGASIYHRYSARWIAENCILFKSSDIGYRAIVVKEKCLMYFANVDAKDGVLHVALFDEQWDPVGIEFCCDIEKDNNKR